MIKKKFILELDEEPVLIFVQEKGSRFPTVYQDGVKVQGVRSVDISAGVERPTVHRIEYATGHTRG